MHATAPSGPTAPTTSYANLLLTRLVVAFGRRRAYPATHPFVRTAEEQAFETIRSLLDGRRGLSITLARRGLLVDDAPVDSPVARDLADRLRLRGVGSLAIDSAITADALRDAIAWLAAEQPEHPEPPEHATEEVVAPPSLPGLRISCIDYDKLALGDELGGELLSTDDIWHKIALGGLEDEMESEALDSTVNGSTSPDSSGTMIAGVERRLRRPNAARNAGSVLLHVADQITRARGASRAHLAEQLQAVLSTLQSTSLACVVDACSEKRRFIALMIDALPADAIVTWLVAAARATGEPLPPHLLRMLTSVLTRARDQGGSHDGDAAFRAAARELVNRWAVDEPTQSEHLAILDRISAFDAMSMPSDVLDASTARVVQQALEIDAFGDDAVEAARLLLADGRVADLMAWSGAVSCKRSAETVRTLLRSKAAVHAVLLHDPIDQPLARTLLASLDEQAVDHLLDVLRDANARTTRRMVLARLREFGPRISALLVARLDGAPWYFARNLLTLLREVCADYDHSVLPYAALLQQLAVHQQEQVRVEALRLLVLEPTTRETALRCALDDAADRIVTMAMDAIGGADVAGRTRQLPADIWQRVMRVAESESNADETRAQALRLLGYAPPSSRVRELLLSLVTVRSRILRRVALAEPTVVSVAALEALARRYASAAPVTDVMERASESTERRYRDVVRKSATTAGA